MPDCWLGITPFLAVAIIVNWIPHCLGGIVVSVAKQRMPMYRVVALSRLNDFVSMVLSIPKVVSGRALSQQQVSKHLPKTP
jgi:hypothetical protein